MFRIALDRDDVYRVGLVGVNVDHETKIARQVAAHLVPQFTAVVAAHHIPVLLHEQHFRAVGMHGDAVHAVTHFGVRVGDVVGLQPAVDRPPGLPVVITAEDARGGDGNGHPSMVARVEQHRVHAQTASTGHPLRAAAVSAQPGKFLPGLPAVGRAE